MSLRPGVDKYLKQLCISDDDALTLHRALDKQLDELAATTEAKKVAVLDGFMSALDKMAGLCNMAQQNRQDHVCALQGTCCSCRDLSYPTVVESDQAGCCRREQLFEHVGSPRCLGQRVCSLARRICHQHRQGEEPQGWVCFVPVDCSYSQVCTQRCPFAVVSVLCTRSAHGTGVLGEANVAQVCVCTQESLYWSAMLSRTTHSNIKCDDGNQCGRPKAGGFAPADFQSIYVPYCVMDPLHGVSQRVSTVIINNATSRVECGKCPHAHLTKREHVVSSGVQATCLQDPSLSSKHPPSSQASILFANLHSLAGCSKKRAVSIPQHASLSASSPFMPILSSPHLSSIASSASSTHQTVSRFLLRQVRAHSGSNKASGAHLHYQRLCMVS